MIIDILLFVVIKYTSEREVICVYNHQGAELKEIRTKLGLTLSYVGDKIGVTTNYVSLIERGKRKPSDVVMYKIAKLYNLPPIEVFGLYGSIPKEQIEKIISFPSLVKIISNIEDDKRLTDEEKEKISKTLLDEALYLLKKGKEE